MCKIHKKMEFFCFKTCGTERRIAIKSFTMHCRRSVSASADGGTIMSAKWISNKFPPWKLNQTFFFVPNKFCQINFLVAYNIFRKHWFHFGFNFSTYSINLGVALTLLHHFLNRLTTYAKFNKKYLKIF